MLKRFKRANLCRSLHSSCPKETVHLVPRRPKVFFFKSLSLSSLALSSEKSRCLIQEDQERPVQKWTRPTKWTIERRSECWLVPPRSMNWSLRLMAKSRRRTYPMRSPTSRFGHHHHHHHHHHHRHPHHHHPHHHHHNQHGPSMCSNFRWRSKLAEPLWGGEMRSLQKESWPKTWMWLSWSHPERLWAVGEGVLPYQKSSTNSMILCQISMTNNIPTDLISNTLVTIVSSGQF